MNERINPKDIEFTYSSNFNEHFNESVYGIELYRHFDSLEKAHKFGKQLKDQLEQDAEKAKKYDESAIVKLIESICKALDCGELQIVDKFLELKQNAKIVKRLNEKLNTGNKSWVTLGGSEIDLIILSMLKKIRDG